MLPGSGRSPGEGNGNPLQYSCLENPRDGGAWWAAVYGVAQSRPDRMRGRVQGWPRSTESLVLARNGRARSGEVSSGGESNQGEGERQVRLSGDLRYFRDLGGPHLAFPLSIPFLAVFPMPHMVLLLSAEKRCTTWEL